MILALAFLSPLFHYIPSSSLAAIIIVAVIPLVDVTIVWKILKIKCMLCVVCMRTSVNGCTCMCLYIPMLVNAYLIKHPCVSYNHTSFGIMYLVLSS